MVGRLAVTTAFVVLVGYGFPSHVSGYSPNADSLEWSLADADRVVHGRVISIRYETIEDASYSRFWRVRTVRVIETLKGPNADELEIAEPAYSSSGSTKPDDQEYLFC